MNIGDKIKALRLTNGNISKETLATFIGIQEAKLSAYERNLNRPPHQTLLKIAEYFKVPVEFFFEDIKDNLMPEKEESFVGEKNFQEINIAKMTISTKDKKISISDESKFKDLPKNKIEQFPDKSDTVIEEDISKKQMSEISSNLNEQFMKILHNDLIDIKSLLNKLTETVANKPQLNDIKNIERTTDLTYANTLLKRGYLLIELYKDEKGQLGFTLGKR